MGETVKKSLTIQNETENLAAVREAVREVVRNLVSKIELRYSHEEGERRTRNRFTGGTVFLRPDPAISELYSYADVPGTPPRADSL